MSDCDMFSKVQTILKSINDDGLSLKRMKKRLSPITAKEKKNLVNEFIRQVYNIDNCKNKVCAVCGLLFALKDVEKVAMTNEKLLNAVLWKQEHENGRPLQTRTRIKVTLNNKCSYLILKKEGVLKSKGMVYMCGSCRKSIERSQIPIKSYVAIDPGPRPRLPTLTIAETVLLSMYRVTAIVYRVARGGNSIEERQRCYRGHMVSFARPEIEWMFTKDCDFRPAIMSGIDIIGETVRVVCMSCVQTPEEAVNLIKLAKDLEVRRDVLKVWMNAIAVYRNNASLEFRDCYMESKMNDNIRHVDGTPKVIIFNH